MLAGLSSSRPLAMAVLCLFFWVSLPGCSRLRIDSKAPRGEPALESLSVMVSAYGRPADRRRGNPTLDGIITELYYEKNGRWQLLQRNGDGRWVQENLVPGKYRVAVAGVLDDEGQVEPLSGARSQTFTLKKGEAAHAQVLLKRTPNGLKVLLVVSVVAVVLLIILAIFSDSDVDLGDLATPIAVLPRVILPHPDLWIRVLVDLALTPPPRYGRAPIGGIPDGYLESDWEPPPPEVPRIMGYIPEHQTQGVPPEETIRFYFDRPMSAWTVSPNTFYVEGEKSGPVLIGVLYEEAQNRVILDPLHPLQPGEHVTVSVYGEAITSAENVPLGENYQFWFQVRDSADVAPDTSDSP